MPAPLTPGSPLTRGPPHLNPPHLAPQRLPRRGLDPPHLGPQRSPGINTFLSWLLVGTCPSAHVPPAGRQGPAPRDCGVSSSCPSAPRVLSPAAVGEVVDTHAPLSAGGNHTISVREHVFKVPGSSSVAGWTPSPSPRAWRDARPEDPGVSGDCGQPGGSRAAPAEPGRTPRGDAGHGHVQAAPGVQDQRCEPHVTDTHGPCSVRHRAREGPRASASVQGLPRAARGQADADGRTEGCTDGHGDDDRWSLEPGRSRVQEFGEARRRGRYPRCPRELLSKRSKTRLKIFVPPQDADQTVSAVASCFRSRGH